MKKVILTTVFSLSISLVSLAGTSKLVKTAHSNVDQKEKKVNPKKEKYDFSLFKFISPEKKEFKSDSLKEKDQPFKIPRKDDEVILRYEKERFFLMFS